MTGFVLNQYNFIYLFIFITKLFISFMTTTPLLFFFLVVVVVTLKYHLLLLLLLLLLIKDRNTIKSHFLHFVFFFLDQDFFFDKRR